MKMKSLLDKLSRKKLIALLRKVIDKIPLNKQDKKIIDCIKEEELTFL